MNSARSFAASEFGTTRMCGASATLNTGTRSTSGSKRSECSRKGLMTRFPPAPISSVWPSADDFTTNSMATLPDAPALFSTTTCRPSCCARPSAAMRPRISVSPPGEVSTTIRIARFGYAFCAATGVAPMLRARPRRPAIPRRAARDDFILFLFGCRSQVYAIAGAAVIVERTLALGPHRHFHLADPLDAASQVIAVGELRDARRRSRRDQDSGLERHHVREKANVLAKAADHVAGMRAHGDLAVLLDADREVLRIVDLVASHDPRSQAGEGIEAFADVARVLPAPPPGIALTEVPANRVAEHVLERLVFADVARRLSDHRAQFAFEIHVLGYPRKDHGPARTDDRGRGLEKKLSHQLVLGEARAVGRAHFFAHLRLVRLVVRSSRPDRGGVENGREQPRLSEWQGRARLRGETRQLHRRGLVRESLDHFEHGVARLQMARFHERIADRIELLPDHGPREALVVMADLHRLSLGSENKLSRASRPRP